MPGRPRNWTKCTIDDPYLNCLSWNASSRVSRAYAANQILPPTCSTIVPYPLTGWREQVARRKLCCIVSIAGCGCVTKNKKGLKVLNNSNAKELLLSSATYVNMGFCSEQLCQHQHERIERDKQAQMSKLQIGFEWKVESCTFLQNKEWEN